MSKTKHTQEPWGLGATPYVNGDWIIMCGSRKVARVFAQKETENRRTVGRYNAARIVSCVNAHDDLVAALSQACEWHDLIKQNYPDMAGLIRALESGRAALAKCGENE